jgi:membrane protease YdiL (CAAX protease family)
LFFPSLSPAIAIFIVYGLTYDTLVFNVHIIPILLLYPLWGTIQQFLIIGLLVKNLSAFKNRSIPSTLVIIIASVIFSVVHYPSAPLIIATFFLAVFYGWLYLRYNNLWILGLFHGWLGGLFYFFVLGRDPWVEFLKAVNVA